MARTARTVWSRMGRGVRRYSAATHRWAALVFGVLLLIELVTGTILLFRPELFALAHPDLFAATPPAPGAAPVSAAQAIDVARGVEPGVDHLYTTWSDGVWQVASLADQRPPSVFVDAGSGRILGTADLYGGVWGFLLNLHDCALTCPGYTGTVPALSTEIPWLGGIAVSALLLGAAGLVLALLAVSGLVAWWPSMRRFARDLRTGLTVHLRRGQYRAHRDLHDVLGFLALPLILAWAVTGAGYELPFVGELWYAVAGQSEPAGDFTPDAAAPGAPDIGVAAAIATARATVPGELVGLSPPSGDADYYKVYFQEGVAPARYAGVRAFGESSVAVDRHTGRSAVTSGGPDESWWSWLWSNGDYGVHFGYLVPWWARLVWLAAGVISVYLLGSGYGTWWWRRRTRRRRRLQTVLDRREQKDLTRV